MFSLQTNENLECGRLEYSSPTADGPSVHDATWFLIGRLPDQETTRHIPIHTSPFQVGRSSNMSFCLPNNTVSSLHAELTESGGALFLRDLGSTNGTYINGSRVRGKVLLSPDDLVQFASIPFRVMRKAAASIMATVSEDAFDQAMLLVNFDRLMTDQAVTPHYQPIVTLLDSSIIGYEVLARSRVSGLENPAAMFYAAEQLGVQTQLSQMVRLKAVEETARANAPQHLLLNTHPAELAEPGLIESMREIRTLSPQQPLTLEIHESAVTESSAMQALRSELRDLNIGLAFDDFGAGQARLAELSEVHPDYLKFDMSFIRGIHRGPSEKVKMVGALVDMVRQLGIAPLAEGIECVGEHEVCLELGFELGQGFLFGRPVPL